MVGKTKECKQVSAARDRYVGKVFTVGCGWSCKVLDYKGNKNLTVMWEEDGSVEDNISSGNLLTGNVRPNMFPSIVGVGINDMTKVGYNEQIYWKWQSMIKRAYSKHYHKGKPTYIDVEVCEEWKLFSNFHKWAEKWGDLTDLQLDKDYKGCGKLYSPDNCMFIPSYLNAFLIKSSDLTNMRFTWKSRLNKFEVSVSGTTDGVRYNHYGGVHSTHEESLFAYKKLKLRILMNLLEQYRVDTLYNKEVEYAVLAWAERVLDYTDVKHVDSLPQG